MRLDQTDPADRSSAGFAAWGCLLRISPLAWALRTVKNSWPTAPVTPTMAMRGPLGSSLAWTATDRRAEARWAREDLNLAPAIEECMILQLHTTWECIKGKKTCWPPGEGGAPFPVRWCRALQAPCKTAPRFYLPLLATKELTQRQRVINRGLRDGGTHGNEPCRGRAWLDFGFS